MVEPFRVVSKVDFSPYKLTEKKLFGCSHPKSIYCMYFNGNMQQNTCTNPFLIQKEFCEQFDG